MNQQNYKVGDIIFHEHKALKCMGIENDIALFSDEVIFGEVEDSDKPKEWIDGKAVDREFRTAKRSYTQGLIGLPQGFGTPVIGTIPDTDCCGYPVWNWTLIYGLYPQIIEYGLAREERIRNAVPGKAA